MKKSPREEARKDDESPIDLRKVAESERKILQWTCNPDTTEFDPTQSRYTQIEWTHGRRIVLGKMVYRNPDWHMNQCTQECFHFCRITMSLHIPELPNVLVDIINDYYGLLYRLLGREWTRVAQLWDGNGSQTFTHILGFAYLEYDTRTHVLSYVFCGDDTNITDCLLRTLGMENQVAEPYAFLPFHPTFAARNIPDVYLNKT